MSTDYSKKKNAELEELLKARSLPHTGKKADLIARLQSYDKEHPPAESKPAESKPAEPTPSTTTIVADDEIDWDDDEAAPDKATDPSSAAAIAAGGLGRVDNPTTVPNQIAVIDPSTTDDLIITGDVEPPATTAEDVPKATTATEPPEETLANTTTAPEEEEEKAADITPAPQSPAAAPVNFAAGLSSTTLDEELEKRKSRAARFGIQETNDEALKALERAKRFGTAGSAEEKTAVKGLDSALPDGAGKKRGRRGDDEERGSSKRVDRNGRRDGGRGRDRDRNVNGNGGRGGPRRRGGEGGRERREGGRDRRGDSGQRGDRERGNGAGPKKDGGASKNALSEKDRQAAEARKKRFAATAAAA